VTLLNPKVSVDVFRYDTERPTGNWIVDGKITLEIVESNHAHPLAVRITQLRTGFCECVPFSDLVKAVEWLKRCEP
jgi:hypothetical protein